MPRSYNVRIVDNQDGTFSIPWAHYFKEYEPHEKYAGEWKTGSPRTIRRLLAKAFAAAYDEVE